MADPNRCIVCGKIVGKNNLRCGMCARKVRRIKGKKVIKLVVKDGTFYAENI